MAIAGKVAPTYDGEWSESATYQQHTYVKYNGDCYISKKPSTGIVPTNEEYWFLALKNVTQEQYNALVNGTTPAGNASKLGGFTAQELFRYYSKYDVETDINTLLVSGIHRSSKFVNYPPEHTDGQGIVVVLNYGSANNLVVEGTIGTDSAWLKQIFISPHNGKMWERHVSNKTISDWHSMTDADTVKGLTKKGDGTRGIPYVASDYGIMEIGSTIDFNTARGQDFDARLFAADGKLYLWSNDNIHKALATTADLANYLPLTGGTLSGNIGLKSASPYLNLLNTTVNRINRLGISSSGQTEYCNVDSNNNNNATLILLGTETSDMNNLLTVTVSKDGQTSNNYKVLHSGNIGSYALPITGGQCTGNYIGVISIDETKNMAHLHAAGGWAVLRNRLADNSIQDLGILNEKVYFLTYATDGTRKTISELHHDGNSAKVVQATSAPSDTTAVWVDTANKVSKIYKDGAWTALA